MSSTSLMYMYVYCIIRKSIQEAKKAKVFGLILGTLGRQGNIHIFNRLKTLAKSKGKIVLPFLMAEINLSKLQLITRVDVRNCKPMT